MAENDYWFLEGEGEGVVDLDWLWDSVDWVDDIPVPQQQ